MKINKKIVFVIMILAVLSSIAYGTYIDGFSQVRIAGDLSLNATTLNFFTDNVSRVYITQSGLIGINESSPTSTLTVNGTLNIRPGGTSALFVNPSGNVGIGTTSPGQTLHVVGNANISQTLNAPVINTTLATQNLTLSSGGGSVIIRLG